MAAARPADPVKLLAAVLFREEEALGEALRKLEERFGGLDHQGPDRPFTATDYYREEMGEPLRRRILSFERLVAPEFLVEAKLASNRIEDQLRGAGHPAGRRVNIDPGYLDLHKVVLASAKHGPMKVHLEGGIYADLVCRYSRGALHHLDWTFQDFREGTYDAELIEIRNRYLAGLARENAAPVRAEERQDRDRRKGLRLPATVIPAGTQVALRVEKAAAPGGEPRPPGSVGVVMASPPDHRRPYLVRFADGTTVEARHEEVSVRRREVEEELGRGSGDLLQHVIYRCRVGSRAFGLAVPESDDDLRGIYLPPARLHWSLYRLPEEIELSGEAHGEVYRDEVYWELGKFLRLALKANPNVLETLWTPLVDHADETARELRDLREAFISKHLYKTYSGYVLSQFRRMQNAREKTGHFKAKHAMHLVRLLHSGISALRTGQIRIDVSEHREELDRIRAGRLSFEEIAARAMELDAGFQRAFAATALPDQPDYRRVDEFLVRARRRRVDA